MLGSRKMVSSFPLTVMGKALAKPRLAVVLTVDAADIMKLVGAVILIAYMSVILLAIRG